MTKIQAGLALVVDKTETFTDIRGTHVLLLVEGINHQKETYSLTVDQASLLVSQLSCSLVTADRMQQDQLRRIKETHE